MYILGFIKIRIDSEYIGVCSNIGYCRFCAFLHNIAKVTCKHNLARTVQRGYFYRQKGSANACPCQSVYGAHRIFFGNLIQRKSLWSQIFFNILRCYSERFCAAFQFNRSFSAQRCNALFQISDACLACIAFNNRINRIVSYLKLSGSQVMFFHLFFYEMFFGNMEFFKRCIRIEFYYFHSVQKRRRNRRSVIRGCNEKHFAQINRKIDIMIVKAEILFRIQCLK